jgi:hypothetical protein
LKAHREDRTKEKKRREGKKRRKKRNKLVKGVDCFYSVGLGCPWTFTVIIVIDPHGSTLFVSMYLSFA